MKICPKTHWFYGSIWLFLRFLQVSGRRGDKWQTHSQTGVDVMGKTLSCFSSLTADQSLLIISWTDPSTNIICMETNSRLVFGKNGQPEHNSILVNGSLCRWKTFPVCASWTNWKYVKPNISVVFEANFNLYGRQWLVTRSADHLFLTFGLTLSGCWIHQVVLVAVAGEAAVHTQLITHVVLQARVHLYIKAPHS